MNAQQLDLLAPKPEQQDSARIRIAYLEGRLREAKTLEARQVLLGELRELAPGGEWNGKAWISDEDIGF